MTSNDSARAIHDSWREKRSARQWCEVFGLVVQAPPRGWSGRWALPWESPLTLSEFYERICRSRLGFSSRSTSWFSLMNLAIALEDEQDAATAAGTDGERMGVDLGASLRTHQPINSGPLIIQIALPPGERDPGFYLTVPSVPAVDDDVHLTYRTDEDGYESRALRVKSVVWFIDRSAPEPDAVTARVNLADPHGGGRGRRGR